MIILTSALEYASRGWAVFPVHGVTGGRCDCGKAECSSAGKHPRVAGGFKVATTDTDIIKAWWLHNPNANIGIATGPVSGLLVVDVDMGDQKGGLASLHDLEANHGPIPKDMAVRTGGGGWHFYLEAPPISIKNSAGKLAKNIDVRGEGGYVVAPPSRHISGNQYLWRKFND